MGEDEARTVHDLKAHQAVILPMIGDHAVASSIPPAMVSRPSLAASLALSSVQSRSKTMADRNAAIDPARSMLFRIGINLGDVIHDDGRHYGDGVNIAARCCLPRPWDPSCGN